MREIKFRAYVKIFRRMVYSTDLNYKIIIGNGDESYIVVSEDDSICANDIELMQYTGNKDINGKEIYEGDLVKATWSGRSIVLPVSFFRNAWRLDRVFMLHEVDTLEVIGNIYEMPELLKNG